MFEIRVRSGLGVAGPACAFMVLAGCAGGGAGHAVPQLLPQTERAATLRPKPVDGRIAFIMVPPGVGNGLAEVYTINPDGTGLKRITHLADRGDSVFWTHWSPDGKQITFAHCIDGSCVLGTAKSSNLGVVNADGTGLRTLFRGGVQDESFSPDGRHIVFANCNARFSDGSSGCAIARINSDGSGYTQLTSENPIGNTLDIDPVYSADGRHIVFDGYFRDGYLERLQLMNADGSGLEPISAAQLGANNGDWSTDGRRVAFSTASHFGGFGANEEIWTATYDGNELGGYVQLTFNNDDFKLPYTSANHDYAPAWAPLGDAIVFERDSGDFSRTSIELIRFDDNSIRTVFTTTQQAKPAFAARRGANPAAFSVLDAGGLTPSWGTAPPLH